MAMEEFMVIVVIKVIMVIGVNEFSYCIVLIIVPINIGTGFDSWSLIIGT